MSEISLSPFIDNNIVNYVYRMKGRLPDLREKPVDKVSAIGGLSCGPPKAMKTLHCEADPRADPWSARASPRTDISPPPDRDLRQNAGQSTPPAPQHSTFQPVEAS
jgi:hypothetical protein